MDGPEFLARCGWARVPGPMRMSARSLAQCGSHTFKTHTAGFDLVPARVSLQPGGVQTQNHRSSARPGATGNVLPKVANHDSTPATTVIVEVVRSEWDRWLPCSDNDNTTGTILQRQRYYTDDATLAAIATFHSRRCRCVSRQSTSTPTILSSGAASTSSSTPKIDRMDRIVFFCGLHCCLFFQAR